MKNLLLISSLVAALSSGANADTIVVNQFGLQFSPMDVTISEGDTVMWMWNSGIHTTTEGNDGSIDGDEAWNSDLTAGTQTFSVVFDAAFLAANPPTGGVYDYFCRPHFGFGQRGTITIESGPEAYCTAKTSSAGCIGEISTNDPANHPVSGAGGYEVTATSIQGFKNGLVFAGISGPSTIPFSGGTLCVQPPNKRGPISNSLGTNPSACDGTFSTLVNDGAIIPVGLDAGAGNSGWYQYWYRDPQNGAGNLGTSLTNAIQLDFQ